jgi:hypothetical protein
MDDLHKPQLDGIGFQDRLFQNINANANIPDLKKSIGKQPAWIEYMTNINKTFGNFALIENEGWMCLNRIFGDINTYTTYIFPHLYNNIFADTDITAQNFWVNTEWIDGETGINAITAIDTSSGSFTLDTLNLAKKVYTMLNRIAVSDGSYNAWIQTVYTSGGLNMTFPPLWLVAVPLPANVPRGCSSVPLLLTTS